MDLGFNDVWGGDSPTDAQGLRPLAWSDLCARLVAAQDLRREVQALAGVPMVTGGAPASFHRPAAQLLRDIVIPPGTTDREEGVNLSPSGNGKDDDGTPWSHTVTSRKSPTDSPSRREKP
ncbi:hypothetical protein [Novosphingobium olei]|uniref:Uncharacterized protein n=1 Tax=Novosphingobium olei TaxID=2728851 RepID=A0A7Y0BQI7_9SPHN|nr:hypothetical protein [Novosphingobium olei]NML94684.1 hypothetical protein [Novosphingobium olei]BEV02327.1 hypothetical protein NSDW_34210 [Novosphingobium olei]